MDPEPALLFGFISFLFPLLVGLWSLVSTGIVLVILLICSALVSGSEVAFFSLSPKDIDSLEKEEDSTNALLLKLKNKPRKLLATILIANNFINIAIVILSDYLIKNLFGQERLLGMGTWLTQLVSQDSWMSALWPSDAKMVGNGISFLFTFVGVTFLLVLFGEVAPKIYANLNNLTFAKMMTRPMNFLSKFFGPFSALLVRWSTNWESRFITQQTGIDASSQDELDKAIQLTVDGDTESEDADLLRGIIKFGNVSAKQVMKSRVDVVAAEEKITFRELMKIIKESGFSRIPVYKEEFDEVTGILYAKDLLGYSQEEDSFNWQQFIRESVLYVPESKKIDDILKEFQAQRMHMAIVVDEFGGSAGIITLEDIVEEVIGEIKDEFDEEEEVDFVKINDNNFIFEGKTLLGDVARILNVEKDTFDKYKSETDSLAGMLLNSFGHIPKKDKEIILGNYKFKTVAVTKRRIEKIHITIL